MVTSNAVEYVTKSWKTKTEYVICIKVLKCVLKVIYIDQHVKTSKQGTLNKNLSRINNRILEPYLKNSGVFWFFFFFYFYHDT